MLSRSLNSILRQKTTTLCYNRLLAGGKTAHKKRCLSYGGTSKDKFEKFVLSSPFIQLLSPTVKHIEVGSLTLVLDNSRDRRDLMGFTDYNYPVVSSANSNSDNIEVRSEDVTSPCLHFGVASTLLEHTSVMCAWTTVKDLDISVTPADVRIDYVRPLGSKLIRVESTLYDNASDKKVLLAVSRGLFYARSSGSNMIEANTPQQQQS